MIIKSFAPKNYTWIMNFQRRGGWWSQCKIKKNIIRIEKRTAPAIILELNGSFSGVFSRGKTKLFNLQMFACVISRLNKCPCFFIN